MSRYRDVFLEEAAEHLGEMSRAMLALEKDPAHAESVDVLFRMAHSIKGMAASLEYDAITQVAHRLEDRMQLVRDAGGPLDAEAMGLLFRGLEVLEAMVAHVRETGAAPAEAPSLEAPTGAASDPAAEDAQKKS